MRLLVARVMPILTKMRALVLVVVRMLVLPVAHAHDCSCCCHHDETYTGAKFESVFVPGFS